MPYTYTDSGDPVENEKRRKEALEMRNRFIKAVRPLMEFINKEGFPPHMVVTVDHMTAELHTTDIMFQTDEYLRD